MITFKFEDDKAVETLRNKGFVANEVSIVAMVIENKDGETYLIKDDGILGKVNLEVIDSQSVNQ